MRRLPPQLRNELREHDFYSKNPLFVTLITAAAFTTEETGDFKLKPEEVFEQVMVCIDRIESKPETASEYVGNLWNTLRDDMERTVPSSLNQEDLDKATSIILTVLELCLMKIRDRCVVDPDRFWESLTDTLSAQFPLPFEKRYELRYTTRQDTYRRITAHSSYRESSEPIANWLYNYVIGSKRLTDDDGILRKDVKAYSKKPLFVDEYGMQDEAATEKWKKKFKQSVRQLSFLKKDTDVWKLNSSKSNVIQQTLVVWRKYWIDQGIVDANTTNTTFMSFVEDIQDVEVKGSKSNMVIFSQFINGKLTIDKNVIGTVQDIVNDGLDTTSSGWTFSRES